MVPAPLSAVAPGSDEHRALVAVAAGLVLILLLLLIALVMITLLWRRTGRRRQHLERDLAGLRAKVDGLEDLWAEAGRRHGGGGARPRGRAGTGGGDAPRPGGRSLDPRGEDDDDPPPGF